jgi:antitoxin (DNA-binding transcriptional repressor) of toxin-antitoxin stability system
MKNLIGLKKLREHTDMYIAEVQKGKSFIVIRRSKPIFKLSSPDEAMDQWERVIDFTAIKKGGVSLKDLLSRL